jgi:hypothetical protein
MKEQKRIIFVVLFLFGITAFFFGQNNAGSGKTLKITNIPPKYHTLYSVILSGADDVDDGESFTDVAIEQGTGDINNGTFSRELRLQWGTGDIWTGSGSYFVFLVLEEQSGDSELYASKRRISFENVLTEISLADFKFIRRRAAE